MKKEIFAIPIFEDKVDLDKNKPKNSSTIIWEPVTEHDWEKLNYQENVDLKMKITHKDIKINDFSE